MKRTAPLFCIILVLFIVYSTSLQAQQESVPRAWILTLHAAATKYYGDFTDNRFGSGGAISLKRFYRQLNTSDALYGEVGIGMYDLSWRVNTNERRHYDTGQVQSGDILRSFAMPISFKALWRRLVGPHAELFLGTGVEFTYFSPQDVNGNGLSQLHGTYGKWTIGLPIHAEFEYLLSDDISLNFHATYHYTFTDNLDGYSGGSANDSYLTTGFGIGYAFPPPDIDSDYDGLTNREERDEYSTNPYSSDTDNDGLSDLEEIMQKTDPLNPDTDFDGLRDGEEVHRWGTNPLNADSDGDGLNDLEETVAHTNPLLTDTDGDGLSDKIELNRGTNPLNPDTDGDGLPDGLETTTSPLLADSDGDGINDRMEAAYQLRDHDEDFDGDGLYDGLEIQIGTDPKKADTDNDGATDYVEYYSLMTDPRNPDSDGDGIPDGEDPTPLPKTSLNPAKNVRWTFTSLFNQVEPNVDETSRAFLSLVHLIRSAPKGMLFSINIVVYGRTEKEARERKNNLEGFLTKLTHGWTIPPLSFTSQITRDPALHAEMTYIWRVFPSK